MKVKERAEILPLGNGCTAEGDSSLMVVVILGEIRKEGELSLTFLFTERKDSLICGPIVCLTGYTCA